MALILNQKITMMMMMMFLSCRYRVRLLIVYTYIQYIVLLHLILKTEFFAYNNE